MFRFSWFAVQVILLILGVAWCVAMFQRRHEDLAALRESKDPVERGVVIGYWVVTAAVVLALSTWGVGLVRDFFQRLASLVR